MVEGSWLRVERGLHGFVLADYALVEDLVEAQEFSFSASRRRGDGIVVFMPIIPFGKSASSPKRAAFQTPVKSGKKTQIRSTRACRSRSGQKAER